MKKKAANPLDHLDFLTQSIKKDNVDVFKGEFFKRNGSLLIDKLNREGYTLLIEAVGNNKPEHVKFLLAMGANPFCSSKNGKYPPSVNSAYIECHNLVFERMTALVYSEEVPVSKDADWFGIMMQRAAHLKQQDFLEVVIEKLRFKSNAEKDFNAILKNLKKYEKEKKKSKNISKEPKFSTLVQCAADDNRPGMSLLIELLIELIFGKNCTLENIFYNLREDQQSITKLSDELRSDKQKLAQLYNDKLKFWLECCQGDNDFQTKPKAQYKTLALNRAMLTIKKYYFMIQICHTLNLDPKFQHNSRIKLSAPEVLDRWLKIELYLKRIEEQLNRVQEYIERDEYTKLEEQSYYPLVANLKEQLNQAIEKRSKYLIIFYIKLLGFSDDKAKKYIDELGSLTGESPGSREFYLSCIGKKLQSSDIPDYNNTTKNYQRVAGIMNRLAQKTSPLSPTSDIKPEIKSTGQKDVKDELKVLSKETNHNTVPDTKSKKTSSDASIFASLVLKMDLDKKPQDKEFKEKKNDTNITVFKNQKVEEIKGMTFVLNEAIIGKKIRYILLDMDDTLIKINNPIFADDGLTVDYLNEEDFRKVIGSCEEEDVGLGVVTARRYEYEIMHNVSRVSTILKKYDSKGTRVHFVVFTNKCLKQDALEIIEDKFGTKHLMLVDDSEEQINSVKKIGKYRTVHLHDDLNEGEVQKAFQEMSKFVKGIKNEKIPSHESTSESTSSSQSLGMSFNP